jgi:putative addiction module component (TIGR02574 family)
MAAKVNELLTSALALTPAEREELAECLWASLDQPDAFAGMSEDEWVAELNHREAELKANPGLGVSWDEVNNMV